MEIICGPSWDRRIVTIEQREDAGILMSGGLDSWVLYNLIKVPVKIFNYRRPNEIDNKKRVELLTGRSDIIEIVEDIPRKKFIDYAANYAKDYGSNLYVGINHIPPIDIFPEFAEEYPVRPWNSPDSNLLMPFLHLQKYHIIDIARQYNIDLSNTLSCLVSTTEHCGECWQCRERQWGFDQLND
jgi:hypothetical protein